jgi:hypothetical protein
MMARTKRSTRVTIPARLWAVPAYLPYVQPALTDRAIERAEAKLGVRLPRAYLDALRVQNGGYLRLRDHPCGHAPVDCIAGIGPRFPSLLARSWDEVKEYMEEEGISTPERIDDLIPFCGDGHYYYCLDYRAAGRKREPRVAYVDVEVFNVDEVVAPDFATFLHQLAPAPQEPRYGLVTRGKPAAVAAAVSKATGLRFEDLGDQSHGYRMFQAKLPGRYQAAWLTANRVRHGFVRKSDSEYRALRKRLPQLVDRFPEHADCGYVLGCTSFESRGGRALLRGLARLPFASRLLPADE